MKKITFLLFLCFFTWASFAQTTITVNPNATIPDNNPAGINSVLSVPMSGGLTDINVYLEIPHTWVGDLKVTLTSPLGTTITLIDRPGVPASTLGCPNNNIFAFLDDAAPNPVENQCATITPAIGGTFFPNELLAAFNGQNVNGNWILNVSDQVILDTGTLQEWALIFEAGTVAADFTFDPTSGCTVPLEVTFTDQSIVASGSAEYLWNFGDGVTSTLQNPVHTYLTAGNFTATLTVTDTISGDMDTATQIIIVTANDIEPPMVACDFSADSIPVSGTQCGTPLGTPISSQIVNTTSIANIPDMGIIGTNATIENVLINITHTWDSDLDITLQSPSGITLDLSSDNGGPGDNYTNTVFQDGAPNITTGSPPFTGTFQAEGGTFASTFNGENINGNWTLIIVDDLGGDSGTLNNFCISYTAINASPIDNTDEVFLQSDGTITLNPNNYDDDVTDNCGIASIELIPNFFTCTDIGVHTVTLLATDFAVNTASCEYIITVSDPTNTCAPPTINCPADINANCSANLITYPFPTATDIVTIFPPQNLPGFTLLGVMNAKTYYLSGPTLAPSTAFNNANAQGGNVATIVDAATNDFINNAVGNTVVLIGYNDIASEGNFQWQSGNPSNYTNWNPGQPDNAGGNQNFTRMETTGLWNDISDSAALLSYVLELEGSIEQIAGLPSGSTFPVGTTTNTFEAIDGAGNSVQCSFDVIITDVTPPTIICPPTQNESTDSNCMFTIPDYIGLVTAADDCSTATISQLPAAGTIVGVGTTVVTMTANDGSNTASCNFDLVVMDTSPPIAVCAPPFSVQIDVVTGMASITLAQIEMSATDACGIASSVIDIANFTCDDIGDNIITLTVTDLNGNISTCSTIVTVVDNLNFCNSTPTALCQALIVSADANCQGEAIAEEFDGGSSDPEMEPLTISIAPEGPYPLGITNIILTASDGQSSGTCMTTITVVDDTPPSLSCLPDQVEVANPNCVFNIPDYTAMATAFDNCNTLNLTQNPLMGTPVMIGTTVVTIAADDGTNTVTCTFNLSVNDVMPPNAVCQNITIQLDATGMATINANDVNGGSNDCGNFTTAIDINSFDCSNIGLNNIELTITDDAGLTSTCTAIVTVEDTMPPEVSCQDITLQLDENGSASIIPSDIDGGSTDNCGVASTTIDISSFDCDDIGTNSVTLVVMDVNGNSNTCIANVTIEDNIPPIVVCQDITVQLNANGIATITTSDVDGGSSDNCSIASVSVNIDTFDCSNVGDNNVILTITDFSGNISTCTAIVSVENNNTPVVVCQNITIQLDAMGMATITPADIDGGSSFTCPNGATMSVDVDTFDCSYVGANNVILTITNILGNSANCTAVVTVEDNIAPTIVCQDITVQLGMMGTITILPQDIVGSSADACGIDSVSIDVDTFDCSMIGVNTVTVTIADVNGNISTCSATITVEENTVPTALCQNITIQLDANGMSTIAAASIDGGSTDNCGNVTTSINIASFDCSDVGINSVILTAIDGSGNTATCTAQVTVQDVTPPMVVCQNITIQLDENGEISIAPQDINGGSTDACGIQSTVININAFDCTNVGPNNVILTVTDVNGNSSSCTAIVTVQQDTTAPNAVCQNLTVALGQNGIATITAANIDGGSSGEACVGGITIDINTFDCDDIGQAVAVTLTITGSNGDTDSCTAFINVIDNLAPQVICPPNHTVISNGSYSLPDYFASGEAIAMDNCTINITAFNQDPIPGTLLPQGQYIITLSAEDGNGFEGECEFILVVDDILGLPDKTILLESLVLYPNPANQFVMLSNPQNLSLIKLTIYDLNGRLVQQENLNNRSEEKTLDISTLQSAHYMVIIESEIGHVVKQLIVE